ncbi:MAG: START domain-containing protein [Myxococcota bacterium]|nr:START domain-containing protein [Myxococcota bacterium]
MRLGEQQRHLKPTHARLVRDITLIMVCCSLACACTQADASPWAVIATADGITVEARAQPRSDRLTYKASGTLPGGLYDVLAVLDDIDGYVNWADHCAVSVEVETLSPYDRVLYYRRAVPWPFRDRDALLRMNVRVSTTGKWATVRYQPELNTPFPTLPRFVRVQHILGVYELTELSADTTHVSYVLDIDLDGAMPAWLARRFARDLPRSAIHRLRAQVITTKASGEYSEFVRTHQQVDGT